MGNNLRPDNPVDRAAVVLPRANGNANPLGDPMSCSRTMRVWTVVAGVAAASACGGGDSGGPTAPPTVDPPRATTVIVSPVTAELTAVGATVRFSAEVRDQNGQAMVGATVTWSSSDASVATVDASGLVTAAGNGTATVTATAGSVSGTATVTVTQEVGAVKVTPAIDTLVAFGDTVRLSAEAVDANAHRVEEVEFSWASSDTSVAVVGDAGLVTGVGPGQAEVTATAAGVTGRADLTVVAPAPTTIAVTPDTVALAALGQTAQLSAEVRDQAGRAMDGVPVAWSSADTTVAAVDSAGLATAAGVGETTITATAGEASGEALVTVMQSAGSVVVRPAADTVAPGDTLRLEAEAFDENGHRVEGAQFDWSSSAVSVARVDGSGLVTAVAEGTATITATAGGSQGTAEITVENPDRAALVALYEATDGPNWVNNENWLTDAPLGEWYGVDTDATGRVTRLDLAGRWDNDNRVYVRHGLSGPISSELGNLANLEYLNLGFNQLDGPIPPELGNLSRLASLDLHVNQLTGRIPPELGRLVNLRYLRLSRNNLSGSIPRELGDLKDLRHLEVWNLTGPIPPELGNLAHLQVLYLDGFESAGPIPPELGKLANLRYLAISNSQLSGPIPMELSALTNLEHLRLGNSQRVGDRLTGPIPPELGRLRNLRYLSLGGHNLSGVIPPELRNLANLTRISFSRNDGLCAPGTAGFVAWLQALEEADGPFCNEADLVVLESLYEAAGGTAWTASDGWLGDTAVEEWHGVTTDSLGRVTELDLTRNGLAGHLPPSLDQLTQMIRLRLGGNALRGSIPRTLGNLANLTELNLSDNALEGAIPRTLGDLAHLTEFHYYDTGVCVPADAVLRGWLNGIRDHRGTGLDCPQIDPADLARFLEQNPRIGNAMTWLGTDNRLKTYAEWSQTLKEKLVLAVGQLSGGGGTRLPEVMTNQADIAWRTVLSEEDAEDLYVANVAYSLVLEMLGTLPWSLDDLSEEELTLLIGSQGFYHEYRSLGGVTGYIVQGSAMPAPPEVIRDFMAAEGLVGDSRYETLIRTIDWARYHLYHYSWPRDRDNYEADVDHWDYRGTPPLARMLSGTTRKRDRKMGHATWGCHGTNWFLIHLLRAVNIPVEYVLWAGHAVPSFPSEALYLSHGDDPYSRTAKPIPPFPEPYPASEIPIDEATYRGWFSESNSHDENLKNVGRRTTELSVKHLSPYLLMLRCDDLAHGRSNEESEVYRPGSAGVGRLWTVAELETMRFWERMDAKIAQYGGCSVFGY